MITEKETLHLPDLIQSQVLLVDKPLDWTSFDVVNRIRISLCRKFKIKKLKVGHAGTLDPKATGLLIICTGKATKQITEYQDQHKIYEGVIKLGATRPSFDIETDIDSLHPVEHISPELIENITLSFVGKQAQMPPVFSAIKQDGKPVYKKAHKGEGHSVELQPREIEIISFSTKYGRFPEIDFEVSCSKGTYIRSLAHDFGKRLSSGAYLANLRRTGIGKFSVDNAWQLSELLEFIEKTPIEVPV